MLKCVECEHQNHEFKLAIIGFSQGAFVYIAECPNCGSHMVNQLNGSFEGDLRIFVEEGAADNTLSLNSIWDES